MRLEFTYKVDSIDVTVIASCMSEARQRLTVVMDDLDDFSVRLVGVHEVRHG